LHPIPRFSTFHPAAVTMDKEMERLELLSLVNRVSQEIFNFTGNQDKTLAEFVISVSAPLDVVAMSANPPGP
jgi:hypothetical protein